MGTDIHPYAEVRRNGKWEPANVKVPDSRNYWAFAKLANVRNGVGFAGCDTGDTVAPIAEPRGLPADTSIKETADTVQYDDPGYVWLGDHSHSWVTLAELLAVNLGELVTQRGVITRDQDAALEKGVNPSTWCQFKVPMTDDDVEAEWFTPLYQAAWLIPDIIDTLKPLGPPEDVRIVFGFDS